MRPSKLDAPSQGVCAITIASKARRSALLTVLRARPDLPIDQLIRLISAGKYADDLRELRFVDLCETESPLGLHQGETVESAVLRVFRQFDQQWLSSGFFVRFLGLERWTSQKVCAELAARGHLDRRGRTSGTRYRLAQHPLAQA